MIETYRCSTDEDKSIIYLRQKNTQVEYVYFLNKQYSLTKKQIEKSKEILKMLSKEFMCTYDETGTIGKRYRRQDEIGTPYCITIDYDIDAENCVTVRNRDTMEQDRIDINDKSTNVVLPI